MFKSLLPWKHTKTKVMVPEQTMEDEVIIQQQNLIPCNTCGRTFLSKPLKKHAPICEKNSQKKRKQFDSLRQRVEGTDLAQFHQKTYLKKVTQDSSPPKTAEKVKSESKWEENHQKLVEAIRSARGEAKETSKTMSSTKKQQPITVSSPNERCPHCDRQFGPKAFDRHVEWCKEHRTRIQKSPANVQLAKERLEARTKYKVPPLSKTKKITVKEKYSSNSINRTESVCSVKSSPPANHLQRAPSVRKPRSVLDIGKQKETPRKVGKANSIVTMETKPKEPSKSPTTPQYDPFESAERQFKELLQCDDFKPFRITMKPITRPYTTTTNNTTKTEHFQKSTKSADSNKKRASVIDPPVSFQDFDPNNTDDDFEMLENLLKERFTEESVDKRTKNNFNSILNERKYSDDLSSIDSSLINEHDNLSIPEHLHLDNYSSTEDTDTTIQNDDVDLYSAQYDEKIEPKATKVAYKNTKNNLKNTCSVSGKEADKTKKNHLFEPTPKPVFKSKEDVSEYFSGPKSKVSSSKEGEKKISELDEEVIDLTVKSGELFSVDDAMYEEYKIYEEMYLKEKEQNVNSNKKKSKNSIKSYGIPLVVSGEEPTQPTKLSNDSAYGSLNRSTPKMKTPKLSPLQRKRMDSASSSGSEKVSPIPGKQQQQQRISKFCHECGNRYPLATAKFCVECGVRRLVL